MTMPQWFVGSLLNSGTSLTDALENSGPAVTSPKVLAQSTDALSQYFFDRVQEYGEGIMEGKGDQLSAGWSEILAAGDEFFNRIASSQPEFVVTKDMWDIAKNGVNFLFSESRASGFVRGAAKGIWEAISQPVGWVPTPFTLIDNLPTVVRGHNPERTAGESWDSTIRAINSTPFRGYGWFLGQLQDFGWIPSEKYEKQSGRADMNWQLSPSMPQGDYRLLGKSSSPEQGMGKWEASWTDTTAPVVKARDAGLIGHVGDWATTGLTAEMIAAGVGGLGGLLWGIARNPAAAAAIPAMATAYAGYQTKQLKDDATAWFQALFPSYNDTIVADPEKASSVVPGGQPPLPNQGDPTLPGNPPEKEDLPEGQDENDQGGEPKLSDGEQALLDYLKTLSDRDDSLGRTLTDLLRGVSAGYGASRALMGGSETRPSGGGSPGTSVTKVVKKKKKNRSNRQKGAGNRRSEAGRNRSTSAPGAATQG